MCLDRLDDAQDVLAEAQARKVGGEALMQVSYRLAFLRGDEQGMKRLVSAAADEPEAEHNLLGAQAETEAYYGRLQGAREFSRRAQESARRAGNIPMALDYQLESALREVDFSNVSRARRELTPALTHTSGRHLLAALTLARLGDPRAHSLQNELQQWLPLDTLINNYWVPTIEAASALSQNQGRRAIELLKKVTPYEFGLPSGTSTVNTVFYPVYLRGQAYLKAGEGAAAETEFQKILGHRGVALNTHVVPLAHLGLARARVLSHDIGGARVAYQDFFALWKDADPDIPILQQAKAEYAKLQ
jgi:hypothetical protein